eukprot:3640457-Rhodomonas_salina.4
MKGGIVRNPYLGSLVACGQLPTPRNSMHTRVPGPDEKLLPWLCVRTWVNKFQTYKKEIFLSLGRDRPHVP